MPETPINDPVSELTARRNQDQAWHAARLDRLRAIRTSLAETLAGLQAMRDRLQSPEERRDG